MRCKIAFTIVIGVLSAVIGYYGTIPIPQELPDHGMLRLIAVSTHTFRLMYPYIPLSIWKWLLSQPPITPLPDYNVTETVLDEVPVVFYRPLEYGDRPLSAVIWIHGGGWTLGSINWNHDTMSKMATSLDDSVLISVGYRLAPMDIFPAAINDVTTATVWVLRHLDELNIDPKRVVVMGESAGGNLAAALAQRLIFDPQCKDLPKLRAQVLLCPCLQMLDFQTPSYLKNGQYSTLVLDSRWMAQFWNNYLGGDEKLVNKMLENQHVSAAVKTSSYSKLISHNLLPEKFRITKDTSASHRNTDAAEDDTVYSEIEDIILNPDFAPLMRPLLTGLPEAYVVTFDFDVLRDDGILYAKRLETDGVKTTWKNYDNYVHGGFLFSLTDPAAEGNHQTGSVVGDVFHFLKNIFNKENTP